MQLQTTKYALFHESSSKENMIKFLENRARLSSYLNKDVTICTTFFHQNEGILLNKSFEIHIDNRI